MKSIQFLFALLLCCISAVVSGQSSKSFIESKVTLQTATGALHGTLTTPQNAAQMPVALIIAGSGPTDRDGNNPMMKNNSLKLLAHQLAENGIASLRYDKRGISESKAAGIAEADLRFDHYADDAKEWIQLLKRDAQFSQIIVIGHSEGSLIGMLAGLQAHKFISIAGAGQSADLLLKTQLSAQPQAVQDMCFPIIDHLKSGKTVDNVPPMLAAMFRQSVQPYLISWFRYNPQEEIKRLTVPVLILQGTNDLQIPVEHAKMLADANPLAKLLVINQMNHVLKIVEGDRQANIATYSQESLPIAPALATAIIQFIHGK